MIKGIKNLLPRIACTVLGTALLVACGANGGQDGNKSNNQTRVNNTETSSSESKEGAEGKVDVKNAETLKDAYANDFTVGVSIVMSDINNDETMKFLSEHFNSFTMGNEMKPENLLDYEKTEKNPNGLPVIRKEGLKKILNTARYLGVKMRGHTLLWHNQTPDWFFSKDYEPSEGFASKKEMNKRLEAYIKGVMEACEEIYPGGIYAWDVVNEAMEDGGGPRKKDSNWYKIYGDDSYITSAFTYARKYANPKAKLFYNDYNEYQGPKRNSIIAKLKELRKENLVDGMGFQSHWELGYPTAFDIEENIKEYSQIEGLELQFTEIDMHTTDNSDATFEEQAQQYKEIFEVILKAKREDHANITNVTFWGYTDEDSWLTPFKGETSYPLLFQNYTEKKPCYDSILEAAKE
ncbi:MAG: endo-1,4-beta-xylanase [Eubacterium sp.]|nr:endo-1,4-beta-xylanase [Eubacterium sp.]